MWLLAWQRPTLPAPCEQVPSALEGLTAVFGMGTGVSPPPSSPDDVSYFSKVTKTNVADLLIHFQVIFFGKWWS